MTQIQNDCESSSDDCESLSEDDDESSNCLFICVGMKKGDFPQDSVARGDFPDDEMELGGIGKEPGDLAGEIGLCELVPGDFPKIFLATFVDG